MQHLSIGLMSGTSMDGIDCALIETDGTPHHIKPRGYVSVTYPPEFRLLLKGTEYAIRLYEGDCEQARQHFATALVSYFKEALQLPPSEWDGMMASFAAVLGDSLEHTGTVTLEAVIKRSTDYHIKAVKHLVKKLGLLPSDVNVIGYHGQCFYHQPNCGISVILGDGQRMADALQCQVIHDFRRDDVLAGGQGAPFAPIYHQALAIRDNLLPLAVVNCGGIANVSFIMGPEPCDLMAFDTGPGNALLDQLMRKRTNGRLHYDKQGENARVGKTHKKVLAKLWDEAIIKNDQNYFNRPPPKSLDYGDLKLIDALDNLSLADACRTLAAFTAETIVQSLLWLEKAPPVTWVLAGGGWENPVIFAELRKRLLARIPNMQSLVKADALHWENKALEAQIFAYLAVRRVQQLPLSYPNTTGVPAAMTGGTIRLPQGA